MLRKKRGALALLNHGSLALSVCCGWRKKKKRLFGSNIFGGRRENKNTAEGPWRAKLSVPAQRSRGKSGQAFSPKPLAWIVLERPRRGKKRKGIINWFRACSNKSLQKLYQQTIRYIYTYIFQKPKPNNSIWSEPWKCFNSTENRSMDGTNTKNLSVQGKKKKREVGMGRGRTAAILLSRCWQQNVIGM